MYPAVVYFRPGSCILLSAFIVGQIFLNIEQFSRSAHLDRYNVEISEKLRPVSYVALSSKIKLNSDESN